MTLDEAIDVLKQGRSFGVPEREAFDVLKDEISNSSSVSPDTEHDCSDLALILGKLSCELLNSTNPAFSYQILQALLESLVMGKTEIENNLMLRGLFINKQLGSETVKDGLWKCMVALGACTKVTGD